jgi:predicted ABC-class ATPase
MEGMDRNTFAKKIQSMDGQAFRAYRNLLGLSVACPGYTLCFQHIQKSPGAFPASLCRLEIDPEYLQIPEWAGLSPPRITAAEDYVLRAFNRGVRHHAKQNRGFEGSGSFQLVGMPQQILKRNIVRLFGESTSIAFRVSLPGSSKRKVMGEEAVRMLIFELPAIVLSVKAQIAVEKRLRQHCEGVEDMLFLQARLFDEGLIAFIGDGSLLPRESGASDLPASGDAVPFKSPESLAVVVNMPNAGKVRGMGIRPGITALVGGGYHGKSTLLNALARGVYPHIPGDGREKVVAGRNAVLVSAEQGRSIKGLDISSFIGNLPQGADSKKFTTRNASGSTSEAAAIVENVLAGAELLLIDEDVSATNFLIRDHRMRELIPEDPITPFLDRARELYENFFVSTLIIAGSSSEYLAVADQVIAMHEYLPVDITARARSLDLPPVPLPSIALKIADQRVLARENFNPAYTNERLQKSVPVRIKALRGQECEVLEYGMEQIDLRWLTGLVDPGQIRTIGYCLFLARRLKLSEDRCSPTVLAQRLAAVIHDKGLDILQPPDSPPLFFTQVRLLEIAGAINRLRSLNIEENDE